MSIGTSRQADPSTYLPLTGPLPARYSDHLVEDGCGTELSPKLRADLLDFDAWGGILTTFGRTMRVAVALTDTQGHVLGECHNGQPVWKLVHDAATRWNFNCPFCITTGLACTAVARALESAGAVMARDQAGLTHVTVPLLLGKEYLGAIVAGQVFDRYPEPLPLQRVAKEFGIPAQQLWERARKERPVSGATLRASGELLCVLGQAFLQQRYNAILEARLAETNGRFRSLVEGVRDYALFTMDPAGLVTSWNAGARRLLGYGETEIVGQNFACTFTQEDIQNQMPEKQLHKALETGRAVDEGWRVRSNRNQFWANVNITALLEDAGRVQGFAIVMQDATERRNITVAGEEARRERARLQETFLSHVSHELRTPLTAIYFFTTNLLDGIGGDLTPGQREQLTFALDNIQQLKNMVSDLLDITRVETHKLTVERQHASPVKLIGDALSTCRTNAMLKNIDLRSSVAPGLPFLWADPARVKQILINLIDNAIKFTPWGGRVAVESRPFAEHDGFLCLSVSDTGCGISMENQKLIFDRLAQVKSRADTSRTGLGLGLFISRELVSRHGGRIWVESQPGGGSTFYFTLPVFFLAKLCAHVFTAPNLQAGSVTLIAIDLAAIAGAVQADIVPEIRRLLERCIHPAQDVLLPAMNDADPVETFFIVACTDSGGFEVIASRIGRELQSFDNVSRLKPVITSTTLVVAAGQAHEQQVSEVTEQIERLVHAHLLRKGRTK
jgi:PAS domain S-box-containing protein